MDETIKVSEVKENVSEFKQKYDGLMVCILGTDYTIRVVYFIFHKLLFLNKFKINISS